MRLGIFAKTFARPTVEEVFDAVRAHGLDCVQFNFSCVGRPTLPETFEPELCERIRRAAAERSVEIVAVSGTFNLIDPDQERMKDGFRRLRVLARCCRALEAPVLTLCTGTRDPEDMWRWHPDNDTPAAWDELRVGMLAAHGATVDAHVLLGVEPEVANVISSARQARRLLDELHSPRVGIVIDPVNLFHAGEYSRSREVLDEAFTLLGKDIVLAHGKELGRIDRDYYLTLLHRVGYRGPVILHGLREDQVSETVAALRASAY